MDSSKAQELYISYNELINSNKKVMKLSENIFTKIKNLKNIDSDIYKKIKNQERYLEKQLSLFGDTFLKIKNLDKSSSQENTTLLAQLSDIHLKRNSNEMKTLLWGSLAIVLFFTTVRQLSK
jgi:glutamyl/glutaminyl-tRNA synthetase